ncbi:MAG: amidohydrolase family protein [Flavobacteriaceae bacterium]|nr:amidohydrolase family protein [Flavobacteriaceae bacterium]
MRKNFLLSSIIVFSMFIIDVKAQGKNENQIIFSNVRVFDGSSQQLSLPVNVFIKGNNIEKIDAKPIVVSGDVVNINGKGKTLMPGLIDVHVHLTFGALTMEQMMSPDFNMETAMTFIGQSAEAMLMRGFTGIRDMGGPIFPIKEAIDNQKMKGPRVWPSGATISQTAGHGDFRTPNERSRRFFGKPSRAEEFGATFIADGRDEVLTATRENLRFGASQIKVMAGGGTSSAYDPVDVTQYTFDEMKAAVEAAEDWGTYVTVHAYTTRAVQRAIEVGVKCVEHGQLLDDETLKLMVEKGVWLSLQNLLESSPEMAETRKEKRKSVIEGQKKIWPLAKKLNVKLAWGTDFLFEPELNKEQNDYILKLQPWFTNVEILKMITRDNGELLQLSGLRSPYPGKIGVIEEGALADVLLVDGNPIQDLSVITEPEKKFLVIVKDGVIYKNLVK